MGTGATFSPPPAHRPWLPVSLVTCDQYLLHPAAHVEEAVLVHPAQVSGVDPALGVHHLHQSGQASLPVLYFHTSKSVSQTIIAQPTPHLLRLLLIPEIAHEHVPAPRRYLPHTPERMSRSREGRMKEDKLTYFESGLRMAVSK